MGFAVALHDGSCATDPSALAPDPSGTTRAHGSPVSLRVLTPES